MLQKEGESVSSGPSGSHALPGTSSGAGHGGHVEHNMHGGASQLQHLQQHSDSTASGGAGHHSSLGHHGAGGGPGGLGGGGGGGGGELQLPSVPPHVPMSAGGSGHAAGGMPLASELENMRAALRIKSGEVASLEAQVRALEMTRDRCATPRGLGREGLRGTMFQCCSGTRNPVGNRPVTYLCAIILPQAG